MMGFSKTNIVINNPIDCFVNNDRDAKIPIKIFFLILSLLFNSNNIII